MDFKDDKELGDLIIQLMQSKLWEFVCETLESRQELIFRELESPNLTPDARAALTGRLIEVRWLMKTPANAARYYMSKKLADQQEAYDEKITRLRTSFPDVVTH